MTKSKLSASFEQKRVAPMWYYHLAENARYCGWVLWFLKKNDNSVWHACIETDAHQKTALEDGFIREISIALELILKAIIFQNYEINKEKSPVINHHNVIDLWDNAKLPALDNDSNATLYLIRYNLAWASRYPSPTRDDNAFEDFEDFFPKMELGRFQVILPFELTWERFDHIYQIAKVRFCEDRFNFYPKFD